MKHNNLANGVRNENYGDNWVDMGDVSSNGCSDRHG